MKTQKLCVITGMFKCYKILGICLILIALFAPAAHAETVQVNPGAVGGNANDFFFDAGPADFVKIVWTDSKTLEYTSGTTHFFFLYGPDCSSFAGVLLDAAGKPIPETAVGGRTQCTAGSELSTGRIDLPTGTIFSGIRLSSGGFSTVAGWSWAWNPDDRPVVGQTEASGNQPPVADAGGPYVGVAGSAVSFDASGSSDPDGTIFTYTWDFGDNTTLGGETVQHTYTSGAKYNVTLTVTDDSGTSTSTSTIADIGDNSLRPTADAGGPYTGDTITQVAFDGTGSDDPDGTVDEYDWDFGDGTPVISGTATPDHLYNTAGTYYVVLTVTDDTGETDVTVTTATITTGNRAPVADAGPPVEGVVGTVVTFDGSNSSDPDGPIAQYDWDYGDTNTDIDAGPNPTHTYGQPGEYTVVLTVTDGDSVKDSASTAASIDANLLPPRADAGPPVEGTAGVAVSFDGSNSSDADGTVVQYDWDYGDTNTDIDAGPNPTHTYAVPDSYTVTLTVTDNDGLTGIDTTQAAIDQANSPPTSDAGGPYSGVVDAPVLFNASASSDPDGSIVQYDWDFDDGGTGSGLFVTHTYTVPGAYTARLTVTDDSGDTDESKAVVIIGDGLSLPPTADANGPYTGAVGLPVTFDGTASDDPDGTIDRYDWAFGDGFIALDGGPTPDYSYPAGSLYTVILEVTDDDNLTASDSTRALIGDISVPPVADTGGPYRGRIGVAVNFDGSGSSDPDGTIDQYDWAFGDGFIALDAGPTPSHTYQAGWYLARLTVTDDSGEIDTDFAVVQVGVGKLPPLADAGDSVSGRVRRDITFDGTGSSDPDGIIVSYDWKFGDGNTGTGQKPTHVYDAPGTYFVILTVTDNDGKLSSDVTLADVKKKRGGGSSSGFCFINTIMGQ